MLRQRAKLVALSLFSCDLLLIVGAFLFAYWVRATLLSPDYGPLFPLTDYLWLLLVILPVWSFLLYYFQLYVSYRTKPFWAEPWALLKVAFWGTLLEAILIFIFKLHFASRLVVFMFAAAAYLALLAERSLIRLSAHYARQAGYNYRNIIIVGTGRRAKEIADAIDKHKDWGLRLYGIFVDSQESESENPGNYPVKGKVGDIPAIIQNEIIDEIIFAISRKQLEELEGLFLICEEQGIRTTVAINFFPHLIAKARLEDLSGIPLLTFSTAPYNEFSLAIKRTIDICGSATLLILLSPLFLLIATTIKITSPGPVFFRQVRVGVNGRRFTLYKFRSMVREAEAMKKDLLHLNEMGGPVFKMAEDPRLTPIGRFIRRTSFDELPQLINVLKGDMSIVGPRPPIPEEVEQYQRWQRRRLSMKPGLTCLWQVEGRNQIKDFDKWMKLDLQYIDNWSLKLDLKIFLKTIPLVVLGRGAS